MPIEIAGYTFYGPFELPDSLWDKAGVYVILSDQPIPRVLDVGEAEQVRTRVLNHDRKDCWHRNCQTALAYAAYYMPDQNEKARRAFEQLIRNSEKPPCGER